MSLAHMLGVRWPLEVMKREAAESRSRVNSDLGVMIFPCGQMSVAERLSGINSIGLDSDIPKLCCVV